MGSGGDRFAIWQMMHERSDGRAILQVNEKESVIEVVGSMKTSNKGPRLCSWGCLLDRPGPFALWHLDSEP